jgi:hypothetical protein
MLGSYLHRMRDNEGLCRRIRKLARDRILSGNPKVGNIAYTIPKIPHWTIEAQPEASWIPLIGFLYLFVDLNLLGLSRWMVVFIGPFARLRAENTEFQRLSPKGYCDRASSKPAEYA